MSRLRIGVIGAGMIAQVEHIPNLLRLAKKFQIACISDPSATVRRHVSEKYSIRTVEAAEEVIAAGVDAVLIASPDALHYEQTILALQHGLHVFCEKPLCYAAEDIEDIIQSRNAAGKLVQVGYMKRFDPSFEAALREMPATRDALRYVSVEVNDPDAWPFVGHHELVQGGDVPAAMIEAARKKQAQQVARAVKTPLSPSALRGFVSAYCSSLVHDVNAVHGLLDVLEIADGEIAGGEIFAGGAGGQGTVRLLDGRALWNMAHVAVPKLARYRERITLYFEDAMLELEFPSPYLNHQPTRLSISRSNGLKLEHRELCAGYEEAFIEELVGFWSAVVEGKPVRNPPEHARRDMKLLAGLAEWHMLHGSERQGAR